MLNNDYLKLRETLAEALPFEDADDIAKSLASSGIRSEDLFSTNPCFMN